MLKMNFHSFKRIVSSGCMCVRWCSQFSIFSTFVCLLSRRLFVPKIEPIVRYKLHKIKFSHIISKSRITLFTHELVEIVSFQMKIDESSCHPNRQWKLWFRLFIPFFLFCCCCCCVYQKNQYENKRLLYWLLWFDFGGWVYNCTTYWDGQFMRQYRQYWIQYNALHVEIKDTYNISEQYIVARNSLRWRTLLNS